MNDLEDFGEDSKRLREWLLGSENLQRRARAVKRRRMWRSLLERLHLRRKKTVNEHPLCTDVRCADCRRRVGVAAGITTRKANGKGEPSMNVKNLKLLFHILTTAQAVIAAMGGLVPPKYAAFGIAATATVSFLLNMMTRFFPWLATEDESDDPKS